MKLYRGENIVNGREDKVRLMKTVVPLTGFPCDFLNGGNPYRVAELGIFDATVLHVIQNFHSTPGRCSKKHFVSFSESPTIAEKFAITDYWNHAEPRKNDYEILPEFYTSNRDPDRDIFDYTNHLIVELNTDGKVPISPDCEWGFTLTYNDGNSKLLLLDVVKYLKFERDRRAGPTSPELATQLKPVLDSIEHALALASEDQEWLVLSLDVVQNSPNSDKTHSAILKNGTPLNFNYYVAPEWFTE